MAGTERDPARIGALLSGRAAPRERIARALAAHIAPLGERRAADALAELLGERPRIAPSVPADPPETEGGRWARLLGDGGETFLHLPDALVAAAGTAMLGGTVMAGGTTMPGDPSGAGGAATPVDWHLSALLVTALGCALPAPLSGDGWCDGPPALGDHAVASVTITFAGTAHTLALAVPVPALSLRAASPPSPSPGPVAGPERDPRRAAAIAAAATLDMAPRSLRDALAIAPGDVLPLDGALDAVTVRADGRAVLTGALGHAGGRLCLRVVERTEERAFTALAIAASAPGPHAAGPSTNDRTAPPEPGRRSAM